MIHSDHIHVKHNTFETWYNRQTTGKQPRTNRQTAGIQRTDRRQATDRHETEDRRTFRSKDTMIPKTKIMKRIIFTFLMTQARPTRQIHDINHFQTNSGYYSFNSSQNRARWTDKLVRRPPARWKMIIRTFFSFSQTHCTRSASSNRSEFSKLV